jgi:hypothetical protein
MGILSGGLGSIAGAAGGFALGGPAGAALGASLGGALDASSAAKKAAQLQAQGYQNAINEQARQYDLTRSDLQPFLQAGYDALPQYQQGIDQAPTAPTLDPFTGQAVQAPTLNEFNYNGQAVQAPELQQFNFDPSKIAESPAYQFQLQQGQQQLNRLAGANRQLGSGNRLIAAEQFGQGLASQSLNDEYQRQLAQNQANNQARSAQFGLTSQSVQDQYNRQLAANQAQGGTRQAQFGLNTQQLGQEQSLAQQEQNRLLAQYGLGLDAFNQRLNRLAGLVDVGRGTGTALGAVGQNSANAISGLQSAIGESNAAGRIGQTSAINQGVNQAIGLGSLLGGLQSSQPSASPQPNVGYAPMGFLAPKPGDTMNELFQSNPNLSLGNVRF